MISFERTRQLNATLLVEDEGRQIPVKNIMISFDNQGTSSQQDYITEKELYNEHKAEMREDEAKVIALRYKIEDDIASELEALDLAGTEES
ncbi:hypothetical protein [Streptococcus phage P738]|nr:hypothetical protein [Streptococcus phage P738]